MFYSIRKTTRRAPQALTFALGIQTECVRTQASQVSRNPYTYDQFISDAQYAFNLRYYTTILIKITNIIEHHSSENAALLSRIGNTINQELGSRIKEIVIENLNQNQVVVNESDSSGFYQYLEKIWIKLTESLEWLLQQILPSGTQKTAKEVLICSYLAIAFISAYWIVKIVAKNSKLASKIMIKMISNKSRIVKLKRNLD